MFELIFVHRKAEGAPLHPDDCECDNYRSQAREYFDYWRERGIPEDELAKEVGYIANG